MSYIFLSRWAWVLIPVFASVFCLAGLLAALRIIKITNIELAQHDRDSLHPVAQYLHANAQFRARVLGLLMTAGILVTLPTVIIPAPAPPTTGWWLSFWINHYIVGTTALYLSVAAIQAWRIRQRSFSG